jgi:cytochrome c oxidase assembly protein subunit 15
MARSEHTPWWHRFAVALAIATFALIGLGGLVTSHGAGMSVPDWPTTYGYNMFLFAPSKWAGGIFYEHSHRLAASGVGLLTSILAVWFFGYKSRPWLRWGGITLFLFGLVYNFAGHDEHYTGASLALVGLVSFVAGSFWPKCRPAEKRLRWLGVLAFIGVVLQGVLGGLRVVLYKDQIGIFHAALAQAFLVLVCVIALLTGTWWKTLPGRVAGLSDRRGLRRLFLGTVALIFLQLVLGATMRHQHAGLAIPDFPLAYQKLWPPTDAASVASYNAHRVQVAETNPITAFQIWLQMIHRVMALLIVCAVAWCAWAAWRELGGRHPAARLAALWFVTILIQAILGATTIWSNKAADIATLHVMVGALSLVIGALLTIVSFRVLIAGRAPVPVESDSAQSAFGPVRPAASGVK